MYMCVYAFVFVCTLVGTYMFICVCGMYTFVCVYLCVSRYTSSECMEARNILFYFSRLYFWRQELLLNGEHGFS